MKKEIDTSDDGFHKEEDCIYVAKAKKPCYDRNHNPPNMMVIPSGHHYKHTCPSCGEVSILRPSMYSL